MVLITNVWVDPIQKIEYQFRQVMFSFLGKVFGFSKSKISVLVVGLDNSGKTTLISATMCGSSFGKMSRPHWFYCRKIDKR